MFTYDVSNMDVTANITPVVDTPYLQVLYYTRLRFGFDKETKQGSPEIRFGAWQVVEDGPKDVMETHAAAWNKKLIASPDEMVKRPGFPVAVCIPASTNIENPTSDIMDKILAVLQEVPSTSINPNAS